MGEYQKTHIPHDPGFYEGNYFSGGESGYTIFKTSVRGREVKFGVLICYDQWFPEAARVVALQGAEVIFYPTAIGTVDGIPEVEGKWRANWQRVQQSHAGTNNVVVAAVNRVGKEGATNFWGGSFVCDAWAKVLNRAGDSPEVVVAEINLEDSKFVRDNWGFMRARRPETYRITVLSARNRPSGRDSSALHRASFYALLTILKSALSGHYRMMEELVARYIRLGQGYAETGR